ncbi:MAG TPA: DUF2336 domain-containing protein [Pseudolabrys sp.]|jgi:uncharacterized protein (DUF2336 family)|nr:DUF2336 domain-containing protein [Pseudolabrys sp.]
MVRHLTDLFLVSIDQYSAEEIAVVDDVLVRLVATIEESARALLAIRLSPVKKAPPKVMRMLACDDAIDIASPVLIHSEQLDTETLVECARTKSQEHMLAISRRKAIPEAVTDILVARGDQQVVLSTASNAGARFSKNGFGLLIDRARGDDQLSRCVGARPDLPPQLFAQLLEIASETVRAELESEKKHSKEAIRRAVDDIASRIEDTAVTQTQTFAAAQVLVETLHMAGQLTTTKMKDFARFGRFDEIVAGLALMTKMPPELVEQTVRDAQVEPLLVMAKAVGLSWDTTKSIITLSAQRFQRSPADVDRCMAAFERLKEPIAQQILNFHRSRLAKRQPQAAAAASA